MENLTINFGKYNGLNLEQIFKKSPSYVKWLSENANDLAIRKASESLVKSMKNDKAHNENDFIIEFGKYSGFYISKIAKNDMKYLNWLISNMTDENIKNKIVSFLTPFKKELSKIRKEEKNIFEKNRLEFEKTFKIQKEDSNLNKLNSVLERFQTNYIYSRRLAHVYKFVSFVEIETNELYSFENKSFYVSCKSYNLSFVSIKNENTTIISLSNLDEVVFVPNNFEYENIFLNMKTHKVFNIKGESLELKSYQRTVQIMSDVWDYQTFYSFEKMELSDSCYNKFYYLNNKFYFINEYNGNGEDLCRKYKISKL